MKVGAWYSTVHNNFCHFGNFFPQRHNCCSVLAINLYICYMEESREVVFRSPKNQDVVDEKHLHVVDEYFNNGFSGREAMLKFYPNMTDTTASVKFGAIMKKQVVQDYIIDKRKRLRARANLEPEQVINELLNWAYADPTKFMALSPDEVKALPPEVKRCIQTVNYRKTESFDRHGNKNTREVMDLKFVDKTKAIDMLNKILGNYALDNKQKGSNIKVENLNINELKVLQQILNKQE